MFRKFTITTALVIATMSLTWGQIRTPAPSPSAKVEQTVGLTDITVEYSRPSMKGRTIFGADGLVPYGKVWRTGANAVSKITFGDAVTVEGKELAKGSYAILTKPGATMWDVHFYNYEGGSWGSYVEKDPAAVVSVKSTQLPFDIQSFSMSLEDLTSGGANLSIMWANTYVPVAIGVSVDEKVMANIDKTLAGPTSGDYYTAGAYMHDAGKDLEKALMYVQKATHSDSPRFWQVRKESLILADLGRKADAITAAKKSLALAKEAGNDDYVRMNEKSIAAWGM